MASLLIIGSDPSTAWSLLESMSLKISLVTISYNKDQFLEQAIRSVIDQTYPAVEYIVVDPGSRDGSRQIIERYRDRIHHVVYQPDNGPAEGLNNGFAHASGDIYGFLNADDYLMPGSLESVAAAFRQHRHTDVIAAHGWLVDINGNRIRRKHSDRFCAWSYLHKGAYLLQQSTFFRASAFRRVSGFNDVNRTCWDGELWLDMALSGCSFGIVHDDWSCFRTYAGSISGQIGSNAESARAYEWERRRMYRRAMGRDPAGIGYRYLHKGAYLLQQSTFFRASAFRRVSGFNDVNRTCWDGVLGWRTLAGHGPVRVQLRHRT